MWNICLVVYAVSMAGGLHLGIKRVLLLYYYVEKMSSVIMHTFDRCLGLGGGKRSKMETIDQPQMCQI